MDRVNRLFHHREYQRLLAEMEALEKNRLYCGHDRAHFLDVARIGYIYVLEQGMDVSKEVVYAYGLLHDIGRGAEYLHGEPHHEASVRIADDLLTDVGFTDGEKKIILEAIQSHRRMSDEGSFNGLMYKADKASRACYNCKVESTCHWDADRKNRRIEV